MNRLKTQELAELEAEADIYPHIGVMEHVARLRGTYAEIDQLNCVITEWQRDMRGTLATLEAERAKKEKLLALCRMVVERWERGDLAEAVRACAEAVYTIR